MKPNKILLLSKTALPLYWIVLLTSLVILLRGHNEPGGGFIAGLLAAAASILWAIAFSAKQAMKKLPFASPLNLAACGLLLAAAAGLPALLSGHAFLYHFWATIPLFFFDYKISTVLLFDLGVYLCIWGVVSGYAIMLLETTE
ncbi:Na(+)/H(+) antiporter subunit B [Testudinibacter sp. TR-2022]|uniref:MnhB domain-containing protein n=1 Tax=Testudinibacter sp. TR-2022 TaxID=2585029 RepID=UPI001118B7EB|nr:MnhB domain-containing protein [Testudinibacter sp. TR-2022]TNH03635.1 Na(+)/H(+) antiporter subunit B [Pasteurellaceae bacterium Phil31]TNH07419.1 Na(+)/H(+) antiporter subunit B [Testudinibacter sp. TR-2022]TNH13226.1 Na(+)/H(+) antiporter subunit B [Testudinibacter sp. TR-2022]TNH15501.1 Na(+)/H(+) antiporter subunit B [Testudinibacter sp. TR-2022]TNH15738.1 Na(+)/H(+) antiporter subunit B [Testudinibacter sp. TR-2022]